MEIRRLELKELFVGERLCLDFINTSCRRREETLEFLGSVEELRQWLLFAEDIHNVALYGGEVWGHSKGEQLLSQALSLRLALRDLVLAAVEKREPPTTAIESVNALLQANPTYKQVELTPNGLSESINVANTDNTWLVTIAADAVDLLCHSDLSLLRQCEHPTCVRVFYDTTKNHKRRWCVEKCGSHSKAAAYYKRKVAKSRLEAAQSETKSS